MALSEKNGSYELVSVLKKLNDRFESDEILTALVSHMIRLGLTGEQYYEVYELGVLRGLRITRLYEFYIASMKRMLKDSCQRLFLCISHMIIP